MSEFNNGLTEAQRERLTVLIEEAAEVQMAATKILRHGYESFNPDLIVNQGGRPTVRNRADLERELGHLDNALGMLLDSGDLSAKNIAGYSDTKKITIDRWLHHQRRENDDGPNYGDGA